MLFRSNVRYIPMTDRLYKVIKEMKSNYFVTRREDIEVDGVTDFIFFSEYGSLICVGTFRAELLRLKDFYK